MRKIFVDDINAFSLIRVVLCCFGLSLKPIHVYYFEIGSTSRTALRWLGRVLPIRAKEVDYSESDIIGDDGSSWYSTKWNDLREVCYQISRVELNDHPLIQKVGEKFGHSKVLVYLEGLIRQDLESLMLDMRVIEYFRRSWDVDNDKQTEFLVKRTPWYRYLSVYSNKLGIRIVPYAHVSNRVPQFVGRLFRFAGNRVSFGKRTKDNSGKINVQSVRVDTEMPRKIAIPYGCRTLSFDPSINSDCFMLPYVKAEPGKVLLYFWRNDCPLDEEKREWLEGVGIRYVALNQTAVLCAGGPVWQPTFDAWMLNECKELSCWLLHCALALVAKKPEVSLWFAKKIPFFIVRYLYWRAFYNRFNIKMHLSHMSSGPDEIVANSALSSLGGISVSYMISSGHQFPMVSTADAVDVSFVFSMQEAEMKIRSGSRVAQYVATGYDHDISFEKVRDSARALRSQLQRNGAEFIICFFDENSVDDKKALGNHEYMAMDYRYLLGKLMDDPTLGLIFKPKKPKTLRFRLGSAAELLDEGLATGRCFMFSDGELATETLPNEASQAADVAIGLLWGLSAATESVLAGAPTLLMDRLRISHHPYYEWGRNNVVFDNWEKLFEVLSMYREGGISVPGFGDWGPVLDQIDPFRDGRAAERMGSYIDLLAKGIDAGLSTNETMEQAQRNYVALWGSNKVLDLRGNCK